MTPRQQHRATRNARIVALHQSDHAVATIADFFDLQRAAVHKVLRAAGIKMKRGGPVTNVTRDATIRSRFARGQTSGQIARTFGISAQRAGRIRLASLLPFQPSLVATITAGMDAAERPSQRSAAPTL